MRNFLAQNGINGSRIRTISYGEERPVGDCNDISVLVPEPPRADGVEHPPDRRPHLDRHYGLRTAPANSDYNEAGALRDIAPGQAKFGRIDHAVFVAISAACRSVACTNVAVAV